jgi:hypothetical protein
MNLGVRDWLGGVDGTNVLGLSTAWDDDPIALHTQLEALLTDLLGQVPETTTFQRATLFTIAEVNGPARPRASYNLVDFDGTDTTPGANKAVQKTFTFYDSEFNHCRIQLMDASSNDIWEKDTDFTVSPASEILFDFSSSDYAWASRKGFRPDTGISIINKFNDALRAKYGMD